VYTHRGGTYLVMEGPQFSSLAESELYRSWNCDVVGMTNMPAKKTLGGVVPEWVVMLTGSVLVAFAAFCFVAAVWRELYPGTPPRRPDVRRLPRALLFALKGFLALVALAALLGVVVWPHRRELTTAIGHPERFTCGTRRMIAGMAGIGASRPLPYVPAKVSCLIT
jgi:hypothetical protein